ncbi:MAG: IS1634 family transposase [Mogibacterium sp.]|nr:IS1634 family transposase [Mogibacterium sp.]
MKLTISKSKNATLYYVQKSYRTDSGKSSTRTVERLGTIEEVKSRFGEENTLEAVKKYIKELTAADKELRRDVTIKLSQDKIISKNEQRCYNGGYLFLQKVYHELGLDKICKKIEKKHKNEYDLDAILQMLLYTRILYPGSKLSSLEDAKRFIEQPEADIHHVYRALSLLAKESDDVQAAVYKNSLKLGKRDSSVIYYDCTNYYFESEEESGLRQYGHSKESRPNPIVQMGLFTDMDGIPLAFCINPGNTAETTTLKPLEDTLREKFGMSKVITCTDGGLASYENRLNDHVGERAFITVQSLKKLEKPLQDWALETKEWRMVIYENDKAPRLSEEVYDLTKLDPKAYADKLFCRERWIKTKLSKTKEELEQRLIVTFSFKYREYLRHVREKQIARAKGLIDSGTACKLGKGQNDPKRFIKSESCTIDGEMAEYTSYALNQEMIDQEARFDGFYGICTDLEDSAPEIIRLNGGRWIIEDCFRITKTDFEARPVFLQRDDRIRAHFLTCFLALILYKYLAKKVNRGGKHFSPDEIISTLQDMNFLSIPGEGYIPTYTRTDLTNNLHGSAGFRTDTQIVSRQRMKKIISEVKNNPSTKDKK